MGQCNFLHLWHQKLYRAFRFGTQWPISCSYPRHSQLTRHSLMLANGRIRQSLTALVFFFKHILVTDTCDILSISCEIGMRWMPQNLINSLWPSDTTWHHGSASTLAQVMACCLMAPSHHLNQCWLIISKVHWHSHEGNFTRDTSAISH